MHYHLEVVMFPTADVQKALSEILTPFSEHLDESNYAFFDYWQIGGRYSGEKIMAMIDKEKLEQFYEKMTELNTTVSGVVFGKESLNPPEQIPIIDSLWKEMFPETGLDQCPLFSHFNAENNMDICRFDQLPEALESARVIFAYFKDDKWRISYMLQTEFYNGAAWQKTDWNGSIKEACERLAKQLDGYKDEYKEAATPKADWICITVDYHS